MRHFFGTYIISYMQFLISFFLLTVIFSSSAFAEENISTRHIPLEGQANFRDIGGYVTADGHKVKSGLIFRSGELGRLSDKDVERLAVLFTRLVNIWSFDNHE